MMDLTQQQEQEMIERARSGDPEANYQMSLWALDQAIAEPEEERWNRLAAKCLVKAAEAGYEPARVKMEELLAQTPEEQPAPAPQPAPVQASAPAQSAPVQQAPAAQPAAAPAASGASVKDKLSGVLASAKAGAASLGGKVKGLLAKKGAAPAADSGAAETTGGKKAGLFNFSQWNDAQWKKMQRICIIICAVLVILIIISLATRKKEDDEVQEVIPTPIAEAVATPEIIVTPAPSDYPDAATKSEIAAANLEVFPEDTDYVDAEKTVTVSTSGSVLNLRRGPGSGYGQVGSMDNGTTLNVYAYKNGWALVKHNGTWGWCSVDYLK